MRSFSAKTKCRGKTIGFVPTMGALHEGHLSLIAEARKQCDSVVVSIFVNPIQFGPREDLKKYPRDLKRDCRSLKAFDPDILFLPQEKEMYPKGNKSFVEVEGLSEKLCGRSRPGHFRGVATVVAKLFNIVSPDRAFFGEKDYQQQLIIRQMVSDLDLPVEIVSLATVREWDGLAMSTRNAYLNPAERKSATILYRALLLGSELISRGERDPHKVASRMRSLLFSEPSVRIDYLAVADPATLEEIIRIRGKVLIALAVYVGSTRLIDNMLV